MADELSRRELLAAAAAPTMLRGEKLALQGGTPVRAPLEHAWPVAGLPEESAVVGVVRSGKWGRLAGDQVRTFEAAYANLTGARHCIATANGTSALITALHAAGAGPGDEVLLPPYTFVATLNAVLMHHALPVFVDSDIESFQMDPAKIPAAATSATRVVIPVHIGGAPADLDALIPLAKQRGWIVIEDACQAHLSEWRGKKLGSLGDMGCFSFQASKNLNSGEGGALITSRDDMMDRAWAFQGNGRGRRADASGFAYVSTGGNFRLTEFQGAILLAQMTRLEEQSRIREQNAAYLTAQLAKIPGIRAAKLYPGCTRNAWHLYMFRYNPQAFSGVDRSVFLKALRAEGVPASSGYQPLNKEKFLLDALASPHWQRIYGEKRLKQWREQNECPVNDQLCREGVWLTQTQLLGPRQEMDQVAEAVAKIQRLSGSLAG